MRKDIDEILKEAHKLVVQQRGEDACLIYGQLLKEGEREYQVYLDYGRTLYRIDEWDAAADMFEHALECQPMSELVMLWLIDVGISDYGKGWPQAVELCREIIRQTPNQLEAYRGIARLGSTPYVTYSEMMEMLHAAWEIDPTDYINTWNLASGYCKTRKYQEALALYSSLQEKIAIYDEEQPDGYQRNDYQRISQIIEEIKRGEKPSEFEMRDNGPVKRYQWFYEMDQ